MKADFRKKEEAHHEQILVCKAEAVRGAKEATDLKKRVALLEGKDLSDCSTDVLFDLGQTLLESQMRIHQELRQRASQDP